MKQINCKNTDCGKTFDYAPNKKYCGRQCKNNHQNAMNKRIRSNPSTWEGYTDCSAVRQVLMAMSGQRR